MRLNKGAQQGQALHRRPVQHKVDRPMRVLGYRTPAEPFADEPPDLQAARPTSLTKALHLQMNNGWHPYIMMNE